MEIINRQRNEEEGPNVSSWYKRIFNGKIIERGKHKHWRTPEDLWSVEL